MLKGAGNQAKESLEKRDAFKMRPGWKRTLIIWQKSIFHHRHSNRPLRSTVHLQPTSNEPTPPRTNLKPTGVRYSPLYDLAECGSENVEPFDLDLPKTVVEGLWGVILRVSLFLFPGMLKGMFVSFLGHRGGRLFLSFASSGFGLWKRYVFTGPDSFCLAEYEADHGGFDINAELYEPLQKILDKSAKSDTK